MRWFILVIFLVESASAGGFMAGITPSVIEFNDILPGTNATARATLTWDVPENASIGVEYGENGWGRVENVPGSLAAGNHSIEARVSIMVPKIPEETFRKERILVRSTIIDRKGVRTELIIPLEIHYRIGEEGDTRPGITTMDIIVDDETIQMTAIIHNKGNQGYDGEAVLEILGRGGKERVSNFSLGRNEVGAFGTKKIDYSIPNNLEEGEYFAKITMGNDSKMRLLIIQKKTHPSIEKILVVSSFFVVLMAILFIFRGRSTRGMRNRDFSERSSFEGAAIKGRLRKGL